ncbi:hypothetical protein Scep_013512 [Stephania cephalantha]|uniref:non-specific serine/threonine protein kinase n=1 Tax=Stephania cephalantha TaxID=152367 RepID=A0AAP0JHL9_9MAGN
MPAMITPPRTHLFHTTPLLFPLLLCIILCISPVSPSKNVRFDFRSFTFRNVTLLGDSYLRNDAVGLTRELGVPASSSGTVIYNSPVPFFDPQTNTSASFWTRFTFSITNANSASGASSFGDGLTFFVSPDNLTLGSPGGYLGLVNSSQLTKNRFVAVEFDTRLDDLFRDPSDNHVGLDVDSLISIETADPVARGIDLKSGKLINTWVAYKSDEKIVNVYMSYSSFRPENPILSVAIDLSNYFKEFMYVGFSASTEGSTEMHTIQDWTFETSGFSNANANANAPPPRRQPHNVSDNMVIPLIPMGNSGNASRKKLALGLGIAGPAFFFVALSVFGWVSVRRCKKFHTAQLQDFSPEFLKGPKEFQYVDLKTATRGFHSSRIVGHGSFGTVYKAIFAPSGATFAVKRSKQTHEGRTEFLAELSIIACLRHKNLVQLQGWCAEKGELLLVYEFMPNGSLDKVLYQESEEGMSLLKWPQRYNIAMGIASVLSYLHQECEQQVIHRDIKTSNIMLDGNLNPRLGDFGLARLMDHDKSPVSTLTAGTMGYLAPEYLQYGKATDKTDVFSFGVVVLEVACGRRPIQKEQGSQKMVNLVDWVWSLHSQDNIIEAADKRLNGEFNEDEMKKLLLVGLSCANPSCDDRPTMRRVLQILNNEASLPALSKSKPSLTFSCSLPLSIEEIVSDCERSTRASPVYEITIKTES